MTTIKIDAKINIRSKLEHADLKIDGNIVILKTKKKTVYIPLQRIRSIEITED